MKKNLVAIVLALMLVFACACVHAEDVDLTGVWTLNAIVSGEMSLSPAMMSLTMTMTINADGTAVLAQNEEETQTTWTQEGNTLTVDGQAYTYVDDMLTISQETMGATLQFVRAGAEADVAAVTVVAVEDINAFNGVWAMTKIEMMGMEFSSDMLGYGMAIEVGNGVAAMIMVEPDENGEMTQQGMTDIPVALENGALVVAPSEEEQLVFHMRSDDKLAIIETEEGIEVSIIFEKVEME